MPKKSDQVVLKWRIASSSEKKFILEADPSRPHEVYAAIKLTAVDWGDGDGGGKPKDPKFSPDVFENFIGLDRARELLEELVNSLGGRPAIESENP